MRLHSDYRDVTYRIYQLLEDPELQLLDFLTSQSPGLGTDVFSDNEKSIADAIKQLDVLAEQYAAGESVVPEDPNPLSAHGMREDPEEPLVNTGICRHIWERKPLGHDAMYQRVMVHVWHRFDYPRRSDLDQAQDRAVKRRKRTAELR